MPNIATYTDDTTEDFNADTAKLGNVVIGKNFLRFHNQMFKISNISRTWMFRFPNRAREAYENAKTAYEQDKARYEENHKRQNRTRKTEQAKKTKNNMTAAIILLIISLISFYIALSGTIEKLFNININEIIIIWGIILFVVSTACFYNAYRNSVKDVTVDIIYPGRPPKEAPFPETYGLGVETNSGFSLAVASRELNFLRQIERQIHNADAINIHNAYVYNLEDYSVNSTSIDIIDSNNAVIGDYAQTENWN